MCQLALTLAGRWPCQPRIGCVDRFSRKTSFMKVGTSMSSQRYRVGPISGSREQIHGAESAAAVPVPHAADVEQDAEWLSGIVAYWLDEEWTPLSAHAEIGEAAAASYASAIRNGAEDMTDLVLSMATQLQETDFNAAFVGPFDVANKVVELLMLRQGIEVCCTSDQDATLMERYTTYCQSHRQYADTDKEDVVPTQAKQ